MESACDGKDSDAYTDAQAVANDVVFEYADELPDKLEYASGEYMKSMLACFSMIYIAVLRNKHRRVHGKMSIQEPLVEKALLALQFALLSRKKRVKSFCFASDECLTAAMNYNMRLRAVSNLSKIKAIL